MAYLKYGRLVLRAVSSCVTQNCIPFIDIFFDFASILFAKQCRDTSIKYIETFAYMCDMIVYVRKI